MKNLKNILIAAGVWTISLDVAVASSDSLLSSGSDLWSSSLSLEGTTLGETPGSLVGVSWTQIYGSNVTLGVKVASLITSVKAPEDTGRGNISYYYGGATAGYRFLQWRFITVEGEALLGVGRFGFPDNAKDEYRSGGFLALAPTSTAYLRAFDQTDIGFGIGYRVAMGSETKSLLGYSTSDFVTQLALRSVFDW